MVNAMKIINMKTKLIVVGLNEKKYTPKSGGGEKTLYNLGVVTPAKETGMVRCSEDVARIVKDEKFKLFAEHELVCSYNDQYDSFLVEGIV